MFTVTHTPSGAAGSLLALWEPRENETRLRSLLCCFRKTWGGKQGERDGGKSDGVEEKTASASVRRGEESHTPFITKHTGTVIKCAILMCN